MDTPAGVHGLAISYDQGEYELTLHPVAIETAHGLVLVDVGLPGATSKLATALDAHGFALADVSAVDALAELDVERTLCYHGGLVDDGTDRIAAIADGDTERN